MSSVTSPRLVIHILLCLNFFVHAANGFVAYDCKSTGVNITEIDRNAPEECSEQISKPKEETVNVQLIQITDKIPVEVYICKVHIIRRVAYCGSSSHTSDVAGGLADYLEDVSKPACLEMHKSGTYTLGFGNKIANIKVGQTASYALTLAGHVDQGANCKGTQYSDSFGSWSDVFVTAAVKIYLYKDKTVADLEANKIHLEGGFSCQYTSSSCIDIEHGNAFWEVPESEACNKQRNLLLYAGPAKILTSKDEILQRDITTIMIENQNKIFASRLIEPYTQCYAPAWKTEHPRLIIAYEVNGVFVFPTSPVQAKSMDLFLYVNSKFMYLDKIIGSNFQNAFRMIEELRCRQDRKTRSLHLALASTDPNEFAYLHAGGPGYTATVMGEVIYLTKCVMVEVTARRVDKCYMELPVNYTGLSLFMTPRTHTLSRFGTEITCSPSLQPKYNILGSWYASSHALSRVPAPEKTIPDKNRDSQYQQPKSLAIGGIYSDDELSKMLDQVMYPVERQAIQNTVNRLLTGRTSNRQGLEFSNILSDSLVESVSEKLLHRSWGFLSGLGNIISAGLGLIFFWKVFVWVISSILNGKLLWDLFGFSVKLAGAVSDTLTTFLVHRKVRDIVPEYTKKPRETVICLADIDSSKESTVMIH